MDPKFRKFKQQESKSHEKLLKVILQMYKPYLHRNIKKKPEYEETEGNDSIEEDTEPVMINSRNKDYAIYQTKIDDKTLEKQRREEQARKLLGHDYPFLIPQYVNGEITLAQLKQHYYSLCKKIDYVCYDNLKLALGLPESNISKPQKDRECYKHYHSQSQPLQASNTRPKSASWNYNTKLKQNPVQTISITNSIFNSDDTSRSKSSFHSQRK